jgi:hypothetical protein
VSTQLNPQSLTLALSTRLITLANIETEMKKLSDQEGFLKKTLQDSVPPSLKSFIEGEGVIDDLFKYGQSSRKIVYGGNYGFKNAKQVKRAFQALKKAWQDAVDLKFFEGVHRIEVSIKVP